ncbi:NAD(P)-dependent alcohol dehydrogenase [Dyadobacter flavalbus]|uniref:NAD(P)-dependent alcohol dehydrogenase n=1 Tax=Dyadobacter flavalbus TaxID=2579942 RepID=A0A5M8R1V8_9BACT|nr:NAD(P)-dependent alcohol dehydrogenase [Dyadobacter flavalbus]KAA6440886.1 NAD(P)-dependent alcohol dehydrogenase [Dyadobacter flavalbus]
MQTTVTKAVGSLDSNQPLAAMSIERRQIMAHDVEIEITYCGICHTDLHMLRNEWGGTKYRIVPGHEIIGRISQIGEHVTKFKVGDLAGIGCLVDSCRDCDYCKKDLEQFCENGNTIVYGSEDKFIGGHTFGGFSQRIVADEKYVLKIPDSLDPASAAPLLCAGITAYSPLKHWNANREKKVGVVGIGGLGHLTIKIAKALGAHVTVFTTTQSKAIDAKRLGADQVVLSSDDNQISQSLKLDIIIDTVSAKHDINTFLNLLAVDGALVMVGLPAEELPVSAFNIVHGRKSLAGSNIGGIAETQEMLNFCAENNITADIEMITIQEVNEAFQRLEKGDVKYRFVIDMASINNN